MPVARDTLLNLLRAVPLPQPGVVTALGVDDFALRRGHVYGTVLLDMDTHRPVDVLPGHDADPLAAWLQEHPGAEIICRDRASAYSEGARSGAPDAIQVADRWHIWHNVGEAVDKTVTAHHACVRAAMTAEAAQATSSVPDPGPQPARDAEPAADPEPAATAAEPDGSLDVCGRERSLVVRTRERYTAVQQLLADVASLAEIGRRLELERGTVRRFARATSLDELPVKAVNRASRLDGYTQHLTARFTAGVTNAAVLPTVPTAGRSEQLAGRRRAWPAPAPYSALRPSTIGQFAPRRQRQRLPTAAEFGWRTGQRWRASGNRPPPPRIGPPVLADRTTPALEGTATSGGDDDDVETAQSWHVDLLVGRDDPAAHIVEAGRLDPP
jgi:hypothetical protein